MIVSKIKWVIVFFFLLNLNMYAITVEDFKNTDVLITKEKKDEYYLVIARKNFYFNENKFEKERVLSLKAKANLVNYLNEVSDSDFEYSLNNFLLIKYFENEDEAGVIGKISKKDVNKTGIKKDKVTFEEFIKKNIDDYNAIEIINFEDDYYVISTQTKRISELSLKERVNAIKVTNMRAEKEFLTFIKGDNIEVQEKME